jgi:hypothetical protein
MGRTVELTAADGPSASVDLACSKLALVRSFEFLHRYIG